MSINSQSPLPTCQHTSLSTSAHSGWVIRISLPELLSPSYHQCLFHCWLICIHFMTFPWPSYSIESWIPSSISTLLYPTLHKGHWHPTPTPHHLLNIQQFGFSGSHCNLKWFSRSLMPSVASFRSLCFLQKSTPPISFSWIIKCEFSIFWGRIPNYDSFFISVCSLHRLVHPMTSIIIFMQGTLPLQLWPLF